MSRIGKQPIPLPAGVEIQVGRTEAVVKGPKGSVTLTMHPAISVKTTDRDGAKVVEVTRPNDAKPNRAAHGLVRSLIAGAVVGVKEPYRKVLEIVGTGYQAKAEPKKLTLQVGYSHPVVLPIPAGLAVETPTNQMISVTGADKRLVGQFAANVRRVRPPEPYNGKGVRYQGEHIVRKAGKSFVSGEK